MILVLFEQTVPSIVLCSDTKLGRRQDALNNSHFRLRLETACLKPNLHVECKSLWLNYHIKLVQLYTIRAKCGCFSKELFFCSSTVLFICLEIYHLSSACRTICELGAVSSKGFHKPWKNTLYPMVAFWNRSCYLDLDFTLFRESTSSNAVCWAFFLYFFFKKNHISVTFRASLYPLPHTHLHTHKGNCFFPWLNNVFLFLHLGRCQGFTKDSHSNWAREHSANWIQIRAGEVEQG